MKKLTKESRLKTCPFCGSEAEMWEDQDGECIAQCYSRHCGVIPGIWTTREQAIAQWNTRITFHANIVNVDL
jgi:Lar family restriction alleviation protein